MKKIPTLFIREYENHIATCIDDDIGPTSVDS